MEVKLALAGDTDEIQPEIGSRAAAMKFESNRLAMVELVNIYRKKSPVVLNDPASNNTVEMLSSLKSARCIWFKAQTHAVIASTLALSCGIIDHAHLHHALARIGAAAAVLGGDDERSIHSDPHHLRVAWQAPTSETDIGVLKGQSIPRRDSFMI